MLCICNFVVSLVDLVNNRRVQLRRTFRHSGIRTHHLALYQFITSYKLFNQVVIKHLPGSLWATRGLSLSLLPFNSVSDPTRCPLWHERPTLRGFFFLRNFFSFRIFLNFLPRAHTPTWSSPIVPDRAHTSQLPIHTSFVTSGSFGR